MGEGYTSSIRAQNLLQKRPGAFFAGIGEEGLRRALFDDPALIHEYDPVGDLA